MQQCGVGSAGESPACVSATAMPRRHSAVVAHSGTGQPRASMDPGVEGGMAVAGRVGESMAAGTLD